MIFLDMCVPHHCATLAAGDVLSKGAGQTFSVPSVIRRVLRDHARKL